MCEVLKPFFVYFSPINSNKQGQIKQGQTTIILDNK
jgi:hypothetical protein